MPTNTDTSRYHLASPLRPVHKVVVSAQALGYVFKANSGGKKRCKVMTLLAIAELTTTDLVVVAALQLHYLTPGLTSRRSPGRF